MQPSSVQLPCHHLGVKLFVTLGRRTHGDFECYSDAVLFEMATFGSEVYILDDWDKRTPSFEPVIKGFYSCPLLFATCRRSHQCNLINHFPTGSPRDEKRRRYNMLSVSYGPVTTAHLEDRALPMHLDRSRARQIDSPLAFLHMNCEKKTHWMSILSFPLTCGRVILERKGESAIVRKKYQGWLRGYKETRDRDLDFSSKRLCGIGRFIPAFLDNRLRVDLLKIPFGADHGYYDIQFHTHKNESNS
ncbi:hypothetical protein TNCV_3954461 [Trichonephila clavipes]|nr:hypothetical protein TNCV_3954461 [Trichonephila clavipes]